MRLVFVNHAHPDVAHVSGTRFGSFSRAMATRGHEVVLLTCTLPGSETSSGGPAALSARLASHDWRAPLTIPVSPSIRSTLPRGMPRLMKRSVTMWQFVRHSGVHEDWTSAAKPWGQELATAFKPDAVWGTFGNTSNLALAQAVARAAGCPWIIDVKDNWSTFLRPGVRELMAWRFRDAAAYTSNALHHKEIAARWLRQEVARVIYSGVADAFFDSPATVKTKPTEFMLIGSTYDPAILYRFLRATRDWANRLSQAERNVLTFTYAGSDHRRVTQAIAEVGLPCRVEVIPHLPVGELAHRCKSSFANCYLWAKFSFHHKLLELLACGRPVISFPGEAGESLQLASLSRTSFASCTQPDDLHAAFTSAWSRRDSPATDNRNQLWKWSDRASSLEAFFREVTGGPS
jgi:hypothetical protein